LRKLQKILMHRSMRGGKIAAFPARVCSEPIALN
jgi:hypothetical protein